MRRTPRSLPLLSLPLALALALATLLTPAAAAGESWATVSRRASAGATAAVTRTLARRGLAANVAASVTSIETARIGARTEVRCEVRVVVAAGTRTIDSRATATLYGSGRYARSGRVDPARARVACAASVAEELASAEIVPFLMGR